MYNFYIEASGQIGIRQRCYRLLELQSTICSLVRIGTPHPLSRKQVCRVPLPPEPKGWGQTRQGERGWGSPNSNDRRRDLASTL
jgi:hypothetical protein